MHKKGFATVLIVLLIVIVILAATLIFWFSHSRSNEVGKLAPPEKIAGFACENNKKITATFSSLNTVNLKLSDGRLLTLMLQASSSDRYINTDGSILFLNQGVLLDKNSAKMAFIQENGSTTYNKCQLQSVLISN